MTALLRLPALLATAALVAASPVGWPREHGTFASQIRAANLEHYDKTALPLSDRSQVDLNTTGGGRAGTDVTVEIRFYTVEGIDVAHSRMRLKVWLIMQWTDERLAWNPEKFGNVSSVHYLAVAHNKPEETEIWVPDLTMYNAAEPMEDTLQGQLATVSSAGGVYWSRPGSLDVLCKFSGLVAFPFDDLSCSFEIGGWILGSWQQGVKLSDRAKNADPAQGPQGPGFLVERRQATAGQAYSEFFINDADTSIAAWTYECCDDFFSVARYTVLLKRTTQGFYSFQIIFPLVLVVLGGFCVFWLDPDVGERLGYGITLVLATAIYQVVLTTYVPVCGELLWMDMYIGVCVLWSTASVFESAYVLYLWRERKGEDEHLLLVAIDQLGSKIHTFGAWMHSAADRTLSAAATVFLERKLTARKEFLASQSEPTPTLAIHAATAPPTAAQPAMAPPSTAPSTTAPSTAATDLAARLRSVAAFRRRDHEVPSNGYGSINVRVESIEPGAVTAVVTGEQHSPSPSCGACIPVDSRIAPSAPPSPPPAEPPPVAGKHSHWCKGRSALRRVNTLTLARKSSNVIFDEVGSTGPAGNAWLGVLKATRRKAAMAAIGRRLRSKVERIRGAAEAWSMRAGDEMRQLLRFETIFYRLKPTGRHTIFAEELRLFLSYAAMHLPTSERIAALMDATGLEGRAQVDRASFVRVCAQCLFDTPAETLELAVDAYKCSVDAEAMKRADARMARASRVDGRARLLFPTSYITVLIFLFGLDFADNYQSPEGLAMGSGGTSLGVQQMFSGPGRVAKWHTWSIILTIFFPTCMLIGWLSWQRLIKAYEQRNTSMLLEKIQLASVAFNACESAVSCATSHATASIAPAATRG